MFATSEGGDWTLDLPVQWRQSRPAIQGRRRRMKVTAFLIVCFVVFLPTSTQATQEGGDPISGTWTGFMGRSEAEQQPITVTLKFDGKNITGIIIGPPHPGEIKTGTFDAATGVLKFEVRVQNDEGTLVPFEGKVVEGTASGSLAINNQKGIFRMTRSTAAASGTAAPKVDDPATAAVWRGFTNVSGYIKKAAEIVPADKYSYRPIQSVRTFGELVGHIVDGYTYFCTTAAGRKVQWSEATEKGSTDKATLARKLNEATDVCTATHGTSGQVGALIENLAHTNLHYGNVITYLRMMGFTPPSS
jgi:uncharacterized damage-inducible protein DinB